MSHPSLVRVLGSACVGLMLCFMAVTVEAQRGGGRGGGGRGGGGGGRSVSRSGPAAGGSFRTSGGYNRSRPSTMGGSSAGQRPTARPSTPTARPSTPTTRPTAPTTRPSTPTTRPATPTTRPGTGTGANRPDQRPGEGNLGDNANREDWQNHMNDARNDRQNNQNQAREDWQDFYEEGGGGSYYYGGYYGYPHTTVVITSLQFSSMQSETQCTLSEVSVNGVRYYKCGPTWYNRVIDGTNVNYVVVSAPPGY